MSLRARVLDGVSAPCQQGKQFKEKLETHFEDAAVKEDKERGETAFYFSEGLVVFKERAVEADTVEALIGKITELEEPSPEDMLKAHAGEVAPQQFEFRVVVADAD